MAQQNSSTAQRGYGYSHQQMRRELTPLVDAGLATCAEVICLQPSRLIQPGTPWDLAHDRATGEHLGPAHTRCNRSEGATYGLKLRSPNIRRRARRWDL